MEIKNRKAYFDYEIIDSFECGIVLVGTEIKAIRLGNVNIKDSYGLIKNGELFLLNMHIAPYEKGNIFNHEETRTRKLLMHKKEISKLTSNVKENNYTLIPLKLYFKGNKVKVLLGMARGKKQFDKRQALKEADIKKQIDKDVRDFEKSNF